MEWYPKLLTPCFWLCGKIGWEYPVAALRVSRHVFVSDLYSIQYETYHKKQIYSSQWDSRATAKAFVDVHK